MFSFAFKLDGKVTSNEWALKPHWFVIRTQSMVGAPQRTCTIFSPPQATLSADSLHLFHTQNSRTPKISSHRSFRLRHKVPPHITSSRSIGGLLQEQLLKSSVPCSED